MLVLEKRQKKIISKADDQYPRAYLIHHMHHFASAKYGVTHDLHHCFLFSEKNTRGRKYAVVHFVYKGKVYHCLAKKFAGKLYDHANNIFEIKIKKINNQEIYEIQL